MHYDNLRDARAKLQGTMCYYKNRAVYVREITELDSVDGQSQYSAVCRWMDNIEGRSFRINLSDSDFRYMHINVGYINSFGYSLWYYRVPLRQYYQGLREDQCTFRDRSNVSPNPRQRVRLAPGKDTGLMMECDYPDLETCVSRLGTLETTAVGSVSKVEKLAFHKNFAIFKDRMRGDYVLEYKGIPTAFGDLKSDLRCAENMQFIRESILDLKLKVA